MSLGRGEVPRVQKVAIVDYQSFITLNPEFTDASVAQVSAELAAAALVWDPAGLGNLNPVWGNLLDQGVRFLAAHRLALSPWGQAARLVAKDGTTTYETHLKKLIAIVGCAAGFSE